MAGDVVSGYLDVKVSDRVKRRGFTPWKVWKKQWCELRRIDGTQNALEFRLNTGRNGASPNNIIIPKSALLSRTESRSRQFAFGIFSQGSSRKPILFLSGSSESDTQSWMGQIRKMLSNSPYLPMQEGSFAVSLVDNEYSRTAGLIGLHGTLSTGPHSVVIADPCNCHPRLILPWQHLHQFHLAATGYKADEKRICVLHTSSEFYAGAGQLYIFCFHAPQLLQRLMLRGRTQRFYASPSPSLTSHRRLSRSEGDLYAPDSESLRDSGFSSESPADNVTPKVDIRSCCNRSRDQCVRISMASDDSGLVLKSKTASALITTGLGLLSCTPGNDEIDESLTEDSLGPLNLKMKKKTSPRRESNVSIASGVYEEIPEDPVIPTSNRIQSPNHYEDPMDIIFGSSRISRRGTPPPLPPRRFRDGFRLDSYSDDALDDFLPDSPLTPASFSSLLDTPAKSLPFLPRCHTMPSSNSFSINRPLPMKPIESHYVPMSPVVKAPLNESCYVPMSPANRIFFPDDGSFYMDMNRGNKRVE